MDTSKTAEQAAREIMKTWSVGITGPYRGGLILVSSHPRDDRVIELLKNLKAATGGNLPLWPEKWQS